MEKMIGKLVQVYLDIENSQTKISERSEFGKLLELNERGIILLSSPLMAIRKKEPSRRLFIPMIKIIKIEADEEE